MKFETQTKGNNIIHEFELNFGVLLDCLLKPTTYGFKA